MIFKKDNFDRFINKYGVIFTFIKEIDFCNFSDVAMGSKVISFGQNQATDEMKTKT